MKLQIKIENKKQACKVSQNRSCLLFHGLMRLWLRNSGLRSSNSLATAAHFVSWNVANTPDVLLKPLHACFFCSLYNQFLPLYIKCNQLFLYYFLFIQIVISFSFNLLHVIYDFPAFRFSIGTADKINTIPRTFCHVKASPKKR